MIADVIVLGLDKHVYFIHANGEIKKGDCYLYWNLIGDPNYKIGKSKNGEYPKCPHAKIIASTDPRVEVPGIQDWVVREIIENIDTIKQVNLECDTIDTLDYEDFYERPKLTSRNEVICVLIKTPGTVEVTENIKKTKTSIVKILRENLIGKKILRNAPTKIVTSEIKVGFNKDKERVSIKYDDWKDFYYTINSIEIEDVDDHEILTLYISCDSEEIVHPSLKNTTYQIYDFGEEINLIN